MKPPRVTGLLHIFAAAGYSFGGARRLWRETAFRHEFFLGVVVLASLAALGATLEKLAISAILVLILFAVEALNTAIECIVDTVSPEWSEFARDAKDLGSLAVFCLLAANGVFLGVTAYPLIFAGP